MLSSSKKFLKRLNSRRKAHIYHSKSNKSAYRSLNYLEVERGPLSPKLKERCDDYAVSVLKDIRYAPWLYVYSSVSGDFHEGWLPSNYWGYVVVPKIQGVHGGVSGLKSMNLTIFESDCFPDKMTFVNGLFCDRSKEVVNSHRVKDALFSLDDRVIFKPDNSRKGIGIKIFERDTIDEFFEAPANGVFQRFVDQDEGLASFFPSAVSTLRLNTAINEQGLPELRSAHLRFGTGTDTHVSDSTQIRVAVDLGTGALSDVGFTRKWAEVSLHPDSKLKFSGFMYPEFSKAVEVVCRLHERVPFVRCIGWDVCVDKSGRVNVLEWNGRQNGIQFPEATQGPCFLGLGW